MDGGDDNRITLTTVQDLANVVSQAIEYEGKWPIVGGIRGTELSIGQLLDLGQKVRGMSPFTLPFVQQPLDVAYIRQLGKPFHIEKLKTNDLNSGVAKCSWLPTVDHPGIPREQAEALAPMLVASMLLSISTGALKVTDEWNQLLPDYEFTQAAEFLTEAWKEKP